MSPLYDDLALYQLRRRIGYDRKIVNLFWDGVSPWPGPEDTAGSRTMVTLILANCPDCKKEVDAKFLDCDTCFEAYLERGGHPEKWDEVYCEHLVCTACDADLSP